MLAGILFDDDSGGKLDVIERGKLSEFRGIVNLKSIYCRMLWILLEHSQ